MTIGRKRAKRATRHYLESKIVRWKTPCLPQTRPIPLEDGWLDEHEKRWVKFGHPDGAREVSLLIPEGGSPYEAMREWFVHNAATRDKRLDVRTLLPLWNYGPGPAMKEMACGEVHIEGTRKAGWGQEVLRAHEIFFVSGYRGFNPYEVAAAIEPERRLPFFGSLGQDPIPPRARWVNAPIDLAQPIEPQLEELRTTLMQIRDYVYRLAKAPVPRPSRHETSRDVLIFTLKYSAGFTVPEIAKTIFGEEDQNAAQEKVKTILKRIRRVLKRGGTATGPP